ncbi:MAG: electron transfer flavoprotein subunit beta [Actinobacteria bacterium]|nr:electron transfer flavoprotein subunit beta [Actinomycetota bacterium]
MNYIVLIKQVPDIRNIPPDAWDWEKGTLRRGMLDTVCNELDRQALAFAAALRREQDGRVVVLTMGPPFATEVLRYALSICADGAVLLTDRKLGGADTPATAYPLSQSIRKIEREMFGGDRNYLIITGMQSVDGDTAQVPPQVAEELGIAHIAYATGFHHADGALQVTRITRHGKEVLSPDAYPALITVTGWTEPPFASFGRTAWAFDQEIVTWNAEDVAADPARIGLTGSRTTVNRIFSPKDVSTKDCEYLTDMGRLAERIGQLYSARLSSQATAADAGEEYRLPEDKAPTFRGEVWVYAEADEGGLHPAAFELLGRAVSLAGSLNEKVGAVLLGAGVRPLAADLIAHGADKVYLAEHERLGHFSAIPYTETIGELIGAHRPQILLFAATPLGRELAPRVAYRTNSGLTADCTALDLIDLKRAGKEYTGILRQTRPALGGNIMASIITQNADIQMSTARPGVLQALPRDDSRRGEVIEHTPASPEGRSGLRLVSFEPVQATAQLSDAGVIVTGGGGLRTKENYDAYIRPLAAAMGRFLGVESMVGASRAAVERGMIDRGHQVGQTGQTVKPRVYVAVGVSGAVQHLTGMQSSDIVVAVNKDPKAPIFNVADLGVVGNLEESIPQLTEALRAGEVSR